MGLDSVELLVEIEKYFGIEIPNADAEKAHSVQAMVDTVSRLLNVTDNNLVLRDKIFDRVNEALLKSKLSNATLELQDFISKYLDPQQKEHWEDFKNKLQLEVPKPDILKRDNNKLIDKFKFAICWVPMYDWSSITVDQFVTAICARNHEILIDKRSIGSTYQIYIAITAITVNKIGVDYYEVAPEKSFTSDLGVD